MVSDAEIRQQNSKPLQLQSFSRSGFPCSNNQRRVSRIFKTPQAIGVYRWFHKLKRRCCEVRLKCQTCACTKVQPPLRHGVSISGCIAPKPEVPGPGLRDEFGSGSFAGERSMQALSSSYHLDDASSSEEGEFENDNVSVVEGMEEFVDPDAGTPAAQALQGAALRVHSEAWDLVPLF